MASTNKALFKVFSASSDVTDNAQMTEHISVHESHGNTMHILILYSEQSQLMGLDLLQ
jgi:hypothetical protein